MKAMFYSGAGNPPVLGYGEVAVGQKYIQGPQWPAFNNPAVFVAGVTYTVISTYHQGDLPIPPLNQDAAAPTPWDTNAGYPNTTDHVDYVTFDQALAGSFGAAGAYTSDDLSRKCDQSRVTNFFGNTRLQNCWLFERTEGNPARRVSTASRLGPGGNNDDLHRPAPRPTTEAATPLRVGPAAAHHAPHWTARLVRGVSMHRAGAARTRDF